MRSMEINLDYLTRVEGHSAIEVSIRNGEIKHCKLIITEGSRYFEGIVKGRLFEEMPEITSRICGICSCGHVVASIKAVEKAIGFNTSEDVWDMRKILTYGERIRSHTAHLYFLALPDYINKDSILDLKNGKEEVDRALRLIELGNNIVRIFGGRDIHPVKAQIFGFRGIPKNRDVKNIIKNLKVCREDAIKCVELFSELNYPDFKASGTFLSLHSEKEFATLQGILTSEKIRFKEERYREFIREMFTEHGNAKFSVLNGKEFFVGALARLNNNFKMLKEDSMAFAKRFIRNKKNIFLNNIAQAIEILHCIDELIEMLDRIEFNTNVEKNFKKNGNGIAAIEVPRGTLWHEYRIENCRVVEANIITPTAQNYLHMERNLVKYLNDCVLENVNKKEYIKFEIERFIRAYDPCFSCSAHAITIKFL